MGINALWSRRPRRGDPSLSEVLRHNRVEQVGPDFLVVSPKVAPSARIEIAPPRNMQFADTVADDLREIGSSAPSPFGSWARQEYNQELVGIRGLQKYDQMRRSDGTVRGSLRLIKTPVQTARWMIKSGDPGNPTADKVARFVEWNLRHGMSISFNQVIREALSMLDYGFYAFEKVWEPAIWEGQPVLKWQKLAPRHPMDVQEWDVDSEGGAQGFWQYPYDSSGSSRGPYIPIGKMLVFTYDREAGNMEGISLLRSAYKHWYYKEQLYKIDAIQKERHGIGIPIITLPAGFKESDRKLADELGANLRTNERAHVVLPPNWEIIFAKLEGQPVNAIESINHHDLQIQKNILAPFMNEPVDEEKQTTFYKGTRDIADIIADTINKYGIPQLVDRNFSRFGGVYPEIHARRIGEWQDLRTLSFAMRNFVGANLITPDERLEETLREEMDMPPADIDSRRVTAKPQAPGAPSAGLPRQSQASNMKQATNAGSSSTGNDKSGG